MYTIDDINTEGTKRSIIMRDGASAEIAVYAHEGLIKQHLTEKTIQKLKGVLC